MINMFRPLRRETRRVFFKKPSKLKNMKELSNIQTALKAPKNQYNKFGGYRYRSAEDILEAVKPLLAQYGCTLTISDDIVVVGTRIYVKATATIKSEKGDTETTTAFAREDETKKGMDGSQVTGAASSYARKYALNGLFSIDDTKDADATNTHGKEQKPATNTDDTRKALLTAVSVAKDRTELTSIWSTNNAWQTDEQFKAAVEAASKKFPKEAPKVQ